MNTEPAFDGPDYLDTFADRLASEGADIEAAQFRRLARHFEERFGRLQHRSDAPGEFQQAGIESFGRSDKAAADAEMLSLGLEATAHYGVNSPDIVIGDVALFSGLVAGLELPPAWKRRTLAQPGSRAS